VIVADLIAALEQRLDGRPQHTLRAVARADRAQAPFSDAVVHRAARYTEHPGRRVDEERA